MAANISADVSLGEGVYFEAASYPGCLRRILAMITDGMALFFAGVAIWLALLMAMWDATIVGASDAISLMTWLGIVWLYLTVIKRSRLRTIGYRLFGIKIVTTRGARPTLAAMTLRLLLWIFGPFNFVLDLVWMGADTEQQTLRDCYAGTYVVRAGAQPAGSGPTHLTRYFGAGLAPSYPRVIRPAANEHVERTSVDFSPLLGGPQLTATD